MEDFSLTTENNVLEAQDALPDNLLVYVTSPYAPRVTGEILPPKTTPQKLIQVAVELFPEAFAAGCLGSVQSASAQAVKNDFDDLSFYMSKCEGDGDNGDTISGYVDQDEFAHEHGDDDDNGDWKSRVDCSSARGLITEAEAQAEVERGSRYAGSYSSTLVSNNNNSHIKKVKSTDIRFEQLPDCSTLEIRRKVENVGPKMLLLNLAHDFPYNIPLKEKISELHRNQTAWL